MTSIWNPSSGGETQANISRLVFTGETVTSHSVATTSVQILDSSTSENGVGYTIWNSGTSDVLVAFGATASSGTAAFPLTKGWVYRHDEEPLYKGKISAICSSGSTTLQVSVATPVEI